MLIYHVINYFFLRFFALDIRRLVEEKFISSQMNNRKRIQANFNKKYVRIFHLYIFISFYNHRTSKNFKDDLDILYHCTISFHIHLASLIDLIHSLYKESLHVN